MKWRGGVLACLAAVLVVVPSLAAPPNGNSKRTEVRYPVATAVTAPLRTLQPETCVAEPPETHRVIPNRAVTKDMKPGGRTGVPSRDSLLRQVAPAAPMPGPLLNMDGIPNMDGVVPPDTEGDIGPNHYVQWINLHIQGWTINRTSWTATTAFGPITGNSLWAPLGGPCAADNWGDPIVLWDRFRSRWVISQFDLGSSGNGPYKVAIAVSQSDDPSGVWNLYCYDYSASIMNDYPKFGVWPDGYYMTCNQFTSVWAGAGVAVFEADKMITGDPTARMLKMDLGTVSLNYGNMLPAHFEGMFDPPESSPGYYVEVDDSSWWSPNLPSDMISIWKVHVDWGAGTMTVGTAGAPDLQIPIADFTPLCIGTRSCIPQPPGGELLDAIGDRAMYRCQYRNYGTYEAMVFNLTVDVGSGRAGIRWFELRKDGTHPDWYLYQEGTYGPEDSIHRWMGSVAQDHMGNLSLGYSMSGSATNPSVGYAGRLAGDPAGTLPQSEVILFSGPGVQNTGYHRWGDYSTMSVDPTDDCTFWYTQEYVAATGGWDWRTRIGAFRFANCSIGPTGTLSGMVTASGSGTPISNANVSATNGVITIQTNTGPSGAYTMTLPVGSYTVTASAFGYAPDTASGVVVYESTATTQDFALEAAPNHTISGTVTDAGTSWPLYAAIHITGDMGYPGTTVYTNPSDGFYSVTLVDGVTYNFTVTPWVGGYSPGSATIGPLDGDATHDFPLDADLDACNAPGYHRDYVFFQDLENGSGGFSTSGTTSWAYGVPTSGPGSAHSPTHAWATNLSGAYNDNEDGYLTSPVIDLSGYAGNTVILEWWQYLQTESCCDHGTVEVTNDGATWTPVLGPAQGNVDMSWVKHTVILGSSYLTASFQIRFHFTSDSSVTYPGWYVDDVGVAVMDIPPPPPPILSENFEGSFPPAGWSVIDNIESGNVWQRNDYFGATNNTGGTGYCADADSDATCYSGAWDTTLVSPSVTLPALSTALTFKSNFQDYAGAGQAWCDISTDGGSTWTNLFYATDDEPAGGTTHTIDLAAYAGATAMFRWRYSDDGDQCAWYWRLDDILIPDPAAPPPPTVPCLLPEGGGLIYGNVYDANTGDPLTGASVDNATTGTGVTTAATPDPAVDDAFYCMYGAEGANAMTASRSLYGTDTQNPTVPHFGAVQQDFNLPTGHLAATPPSLEITLVPDSTGSQTLTLQNIGDADVNWTVHELPGHVSAPSGNLFAKKHSPTGLTKAQMMTRAFRQEREEEAEEAGEARKDRIVLSLKDREDIEAKARAGAKKTKGEKKAVPARPAFSAAGRQPQGILPLDAWPPSGPVQLVLDDGAAEDAIGLNSSAGSFMFLWFNRFTPDAGDFPFALDQVSVILGNGAASVGDTIQLAVYQDVDGNGDPSNAMLLATFDETVQYSDGATWNNYTLSPPVLCSGPGDVLVGVVDRFVTSGVTPPIYPAAIDETSTQGRSWVASWTTDPPDPPVLPADDFWGIIDGFGIPGNWMIRASGYPADIPWISEAPASGAVPGSGSQTVTVTYDTTGMTPGDYLATLSFTNDTPYGDLKVPVTLHVMQPVTATCGADNHTGMAPMTVNFAGGATGGIPPYTYDWDFGDGSPHSTAQNPTHVYYMGGTFNVVLTVADDGAHTDTDSTVMQVTPPYVKIMHFFMDDGGTCQVCLNRLTGEYQWNIFSGPAAGTYSGTGKAYNNATMFFNAPEDPNMFYVYYDPNGHQAWGYFWLSPYYTQLWDTDTTNNPEECMTVVPD